MVNWTAEKLKSLGVTVELAELGDQTLHDGCVLPLPQVILGVLGNVSGHYYSSSFFFLSSSLSLYIYLSDSGQCIC